MTIGPVSIGCAKDAVDLQVMSGHLLEAGHTLVPDPDDADVGATGADPVGSRFAHDVWYVDHRSLWVDAKILFLAIGAVFAARGI